MPKDSARGWASPWLIWALNRWDRAILVGMRVVGIRSGRTTGSRRRKTAGRKEKAAEIEEKHRSRAQNARIAARKRDSRKPRRRLKRWRKLSICTVCYYLANSSALPALGQRLSAKSESAASSSFLLRGSWDCRCQPLGAGPGFSFSLSTPAGFWLSPLSRCASSASEQPGWLEGIRRSS